MCVLKTNILSYLIQFWANYKAFIDNKPKQIKKITAHHTHNIISQLIVLLLCNKIFFRTSLFQTCLIE